MSTTIYYFTGTGNSLAVAKKLSEKLDNAKLLSVPKTMQQETIEAGEVIGIVCPIYMFNMPLIVADFIRKMKQPDYFFIVFAGGGDLGSCVTVTRKLCNAQNLTVSSVFNIQMPSNYTPYGATPEDKQKELFANCEKQVEEIAKVIRAREQFMAKNTAGFFRTYIHPGLLYKLGYQFIPKMGKSFIVDEKCNGCGTCEKVCPVNNIKMVDGKPVYDSHCQQCYACLQWCPQEAIQVGKKTAGIQRYHHPEVKVSEIIHASVKI